MCHDATKIITIRHHKTNSSPIPPEVPMRIMVTSVQWAWWRSFISSCNIIEIDGMPIPCCKIKRCHTQLSYLCGSEIIIITALVCLDKIVPTYADREHRSNLVHSIAVSSNADIWVLRFGVFHIELCCNVLNECFHSPGTAPDTHKLGGGENLNTSLNTGDFEGVLPRMMKWRKLLWHHWTSLAGREIWFLNWSGKGRHLSVHPGMGYSRTQAWGGRQEWGQNKKKGFSFIAHWC